jgi:glutaredoxin 3
MALVEMYTTMTCSFCLRAKRLLTQRGADAVREIDVSFGREEMVERTGGATSVPQIFIGGEHVGGFAELVDWDRSGRLALALAS